jgi:hypothetical protein
MIPLVGNLVGLHGVDEHVYYSLETVWLDASLQSRRFWQLTWVAFLR